MDAALYCRMSPRPRGKSPNPKGGESPNPKGGELGVARQEQECRKLCAAKGWQVKKVYVDVDKSAHKGVPRPDYERMLKDVEAGAVQAIVAWHPDRLYRRIMDLEGLITLVEATKCELATVTAGEIDLNTPSGRLNARLLGAVARYEGEHKAERQLLRYEQMRADGWFTGGKRPYGYHFVGEHVRDEPRILAESKAEAEVIREAAERVLTKNHNLWQIVRDFNDRRIPTPKGGKRWRRTTLLEVLVNARISGRVEYRRDRKGERVTYNRLEEAQMVGDANWPAIISPGDQDKLRARLIGGEERRRGRPPKHLLTGGLSRCGRCGSALATHTQKAGVASPGSRATRDLFCRSVRGGGEGNACGKVSIRADKVEQIVAEAVLCRVDEGALDVALGEPDQGVLEDLAEVEAQQGELSAMWADRQITSVEWNRARAPLAARQKELKRRLDASRAKVGLGGLPGDLRPAWENGELTEQQQRAVVEHFVESVIIQPATRPYNVFNRDRIVLQWRA